MTRNIYCDESGIGKIDADPNLVVAGVIVHVDDQWFALEKYLRLMVDDCAAFRTLPENFHFHATDLFHGSRQFSREQWPEEVRHRILDELVGIPAKFSLPIVFGIADRQRIIDQFPNESPQRHLSWAYQRAAMSLMMQAQAFMINSGDDGELATLIFENTPRIPKDLKLLHREMRDIDSSLLAQDEGHKWLPVDRIIDTPHFAEKNETSLLQIADACVFAIKRKLQRARMWHRFYEPVQQQCVFLHKDELDGASKPTTERIRYRVIPGEKG